MHIVDFRGDAVSGATAPALKHFEAALGDYQSWRGDPTPQVAAALQEAPGFVMAHVLDAYLQVCNRDPRAIKAAQSIHARTAHLRANPRECMHLAAIGAVARDNYEQATTVLGQLLEEYPRDVLALQAVHALDYLTGDSAVMGERTRRVMSAWSPQLPGYHAVLSMYAFAQAERGEYEHGQDLAMQALELRPDDARAYHAIAHVFEMSGRVEEGIGWLRKHETSWGVNTPVAIHCWWHVALLHLQREDIARALAVYDQHVRRQPSTTISDLIDASSLLWRVFLQEGDVAERWAELAACWTPRVRDRFCTFTDVHAMLAFIGARDSASAQSLLHALSEQQRARTRYGVSTRIIGLQACEALIAFGQNDYTTAARLLGALPAVAHRLGGSHAQRDVLHVTLIEAVQRIRRPTRALRAAA
ncbi:MAG: tetratricopeptide repeat protein [Burkholderiales bacterium]